MSDRIRLLLVDDHPIVRDGLRGQLQTQPDFAVVAEAGSADEALAVLNRLTVEVVITDLRMPGIDGIELIRAIRSAHQDVELLVLTTFDSREDVTAALAAGARSYVVKDTERARLFEAVRATARGRPALSPSVQRQVHTDARDTATVGASAEPALSEREHQVLTLVARGRTNAQIGAALFIGEATVKTHLQHIYAKLGASDRAAAVALAYHRQLL